MKPLRVAYDVSFPAVYHDRGDKITGIGRVIENVARELMASGEVEVLFTGCYGGDPRPGYTSALAHRYWEDVWKPQGAGFMESTASRSGLSPALQRQLLTANAWKDEGLSVPRQLTRKGLNAFSRWDAQPRLDPTAFDIFHATFNPPPVARLMPGRPQVLTIYDLIPLEDPPESVSHRLLRDTLRSIDPATTWAICISEFTRQELLRVTTLAADRAIVAPLAAEAVFRPRKDPADLAAVQRAHALPDSPYLLSVGNPQPRKNIPHLIRCFQRLAQEPAHAALQLVIAGSRHLGWGHDSIDAQLAAAPTVRSRIHFIGQVPDENLAVLYSHCRAFIFPSLYEGFGLPPLEAMQCGAPVICSPLTSLPEVTGDAALLVDPRDEDALLEAIRLLQRDDAQRAALSEKSLRRAALFSWKQTAARVLETYRAAAQSSLR